MVIRAPSGITPRQRIQLLVLGERVRRGVDGREPVVRDGPRDGVEPPRELPPRVAHRAAGPLRDVPAPERPRGEPRAEVQRARVGNL